MLENSETYRLFATVSQEWENTHANLRKAIETYVSASNVLAVATASNPLWRFGNLTPTLENNLESLSLDLLELDKTRVILAKTRNTQYSPISRLPSELLASIFQIAVDTAYPREIADSAGYINPAATLVQVCSRWRQVTLEAGSLWSCVVLLYKDNENYGKVSTTVQTQLERTRGSPIDLFISHKFFTPAYQIFRPTLDPIKPYMKQLRSLNLNFYRNNDIESTLECLLENGTAGSLSRLEISGRNSFPPLFERANSQTLDRLDEHMGSVRMLSLQSVIFDWKCAVFEQLDKLELKNVCSLSSPNSTQLAELLSASPNLRHLTLKRVYVGGDESTTHPPVKLQCLKTLTLHELGDAEFRRVASVLTPGEQGSELNIDCDLNNPAMLESLRLLASGGNISAFCLMAFPKRQPLPEILESLPSLKCLVLGGLELGYSDFNALVTLQEVACSLSLDTLHLWECFIKVDTETQAGDGNIGITTKVLDIGPTTELGIWLTENVTGKINNAAKRSRLVLSKI
ncbi:hypothetical protein BDV93DRAFT_545248 [Ceratobasidium sp. AG-I]|nr:hypothetical protein BDV93DRAFT_545248 [Ceratobasidium sp. AG-I]